MRLYELCGADRELRFSPFCWRVRLALAHKGLEPECVPTRFLEKDPYAPAGAKTVPVLEDDGVWVADSWAIACYLEDTYPDRPSLFGGPIGRAEARFINFWTDFTVARGLLPMYAADIHACLDAKNQAYFRETREQRLGCSLEAGRDRRDELIGPFRNSLGPLRAMLAEQPYICGEAPAYADFCAVSPFIWVHCVSPTDPLEANDPVADWRARMFSACGGLAEQAKRAA